jgi:hypothetical protein
VVHGLLGVSRAIGGSTPKASAARNITLRGCPPMPGITAFSMKLNGIGGAGVLGQPDVGVVGLARSGSRITFSSTEPKRMAR